MNIFKYKLLELCLYTRISFAYLTYAPNWAFPCQPLENYWRMWCIKKMLLLQVGHGKHQISQ